VTRRVFLGVDCGTQSTKVVLVDAADPSVVVATGRSAHELIERADGTREQDPRWWLDALVSAARHALAEAGAVEVAGIGVSGQQHGLVCLDERDQPVRPAKLWNDTTTAPDCEWLTRKLGGEDAVLGLTGNLFLPGYTAPKVSWLHRSEPEAYAKTRRMCLPHDFLNLWLTGEFATEPGDASGTAFFDVRTRLYSEPVLALLDGAREWSTTLPPVIESLSEIGTLREESAKALGVKEGVPVSAGGGDNMQAAIGSGATRPGPVVVSLGTSGTAFAYSAEPAVDPRGEAAAFCDSTGAWLPLVCTLNCTVATEWVRHLFGLADHAAFEAALHAAPPGAMGLTFLPHLGGERTPNCPTGAGIFAGIRAEHGLEHFVRAVVEGVTFGLRYALDGLRRAGVTPAEITLVGGGAASDGWAQLCADVSELPVQRPPQTEAAAVGAALQARWVVDGVAPAPVLSEAPRWEPRANAALAAARDRAHQIRNLAVTENL